MILNADGWFIWLSRTTQRVSESDPRSPRDSEQLRDISCPEATKHCVTLLDVNVAGRGFLFGHLLKSAENKQCHISEQVTGFRHLICQHLLPPRIHSLKPDRPGEIIRDLNTTLNVLDKESRSIFNEFLPSRFI